MVKSEKEEKMVDKLQENVKKKVQKLFREHGLSTSRRIGLQKSIREALVRSAMTGTILPM